MTVGGVGEASLKAALEIQESYADPLIVLLADDPSSNADLTEVETVEELRSRLRL